MMGYSERYFPVRSSGWNLLNSHEFSIGGNSQEFAAFCLSSILTRSILINMSTSVDVDFSVAGTLDAVFEAEVERVRTQKGSRISKMFAPDLQVVLGVD